MPNDLTAKRNLLNSRSESQRQKLASSGFTASIWTISGVVLVACGTVEDFLGLDDGGGGGRSVHVQSSPVQGARIYFDADGDGMISAPERAAQDAFRPEGFVSDENGDVPDIPSHLYGTPFVAYLDGAFDADTDEPLSGTLHSIPDENGDHTLASPITDFIAGEVMRQAGPLTHEQLADAIDDIVERIIEIDPDADTEAAVNAFLGMVSDPTNYDGSSGVDALARYLVAEAEAQRTPTEALVEAEVAKFLGDDPTAPFTATVTASTVTIGAHDEYIATIEAVSPTGAVRYNIDDPSGAFTVNERGVILVADSTRLSPGMMTLDVMVTNDDGDSETVSVAITVADSTPTLESTTQSGTVAENAMGVMDLISGISVPGVTTPTWVIRAPGGLSNKFDVIADTANPGTHKLVLKSGEMLDHEAFSNGVISLQVWAVDSGVRSAPLTLTVMVENANDAPVFQSETLNPDLDYSPEIEETTAIGTEIARVEARDVDSAVVTYAITNGNTALVDNNGDPTGEMLFSIRGNGAIILNAPLDYETATSHTLTVTATDDDDTPLMDTATVTITVTDANDETPEVTAPADGTIRTTTGNPTDMNTGYSITVTDADMTADSMGTLMVTPNDPRFTFERVGVTDTWNLVLLENQAVTVGTISLGYTATDGENPTSGTITLMAVDTPVMFTAPAAAARTIPLDENNMAGAAVATVTATSSDADGMVHIRSFALVEANGDAYTGGIFDIDTTGGGTASAEARITITNANALNFEDTESYTLYVLATDTNDETNTLMLTVNVDDVNEHAPAFAQSAYMAEISESRTAADGSFLEITATDADGTNDVVTYSITAGDPDDLFFIDPNSGALRVADGATLNYDTTPTATTGYTLTITATDSDADNPMLSTQDVIITLTDANDIVPVVTPPQSGAFRVRTTGTEDASGNAAASTGYSITIDDADTNNAFTFGLDASSRFEFRDQGSGVWELFLKAGAAVTEAEGGTITVNYQVNDGANELPPSTATLSVVATPVTFTSPSDVPLPEGSDVGYGVTTVRAESTNPDNSSADITDYRFVVGGALMTNDQEFTISRKLGVITLSNVLDYDADGAVRVFNLVVRATDENGETNDQMLTIRLGDENDNAPVFAASTYTETVDETYAVGTEIARVSATDADGSDEYSTVIYSITAGNTALLDADDNPTGEMLFSIGSDGVITLNAPLDFETAQSHILTIGASDGADADGMDDTVIDATATVTINVRDINDESPSVPNHAATGSARITTVEDNPANGNGVSMGYVVAVTDADADATNTLEVNVAGDPGDRFEFRRQTGMDTWELYLKAGEVIDESVGDEISLSYTVTDGGAPLTAPVNNSFILTAVDTPVRFTPPMTTALMVDENNANWELVLVAVSDAGGGDTSPIAKYEFFDGTSTDTTFGDFSITTNNDKHGVITISDAFDFETDSTTHKLIVRATDSRDDPEIQDIEFTITVRDLNEAPVFAETAYTATIPEDMAVGTTVTTVSATDEDTGTNGQVRYAITGGTGMEFFQILDPTSGAITVKQALNYDTTPATTGYMLEITATDGGALTDTAMVDITLTGVDDEAPSGQEVTAGSMGQIGEIAGSGTAPVGGKGADYRITITDLDTTSGFTFTFSGTTALEQELAPKFDFIEGNNDQWALTLKAGETLDRDDSRYPIDSTITLKYTISDGSNNLSEEYEVDVRIADANDKAPTVVVAQVDSSVDIAVNERIEGNAAAIAVTGLTIMVDDTDATSAHQSGVGIVPTLRILNADNNTENANFGVAGFGSTGGVGTWKIQLNSGKALDYETTSTLSLKIEVSDGVNTPNMSEAFTVTVNNLDEGTATYAVSGSVAEDATLTAMLVAGREDPDGVDSSVDVMYRWFRKASADPNPTSFTDSGSGDFQWLQDAESTTNTYTISGMPVAGQYGVLVSYKDNSVGDDLSFVPVIASALKFGASSYSGSIDEDGNNITTIDIDATLDDSADNITYAFVTDADAGTTDTTHLGFTINGAGEISFTGTAATDLDYDTDPRTEQIELTVRATYDDSNNATPNPFSDVDVVVTINDLNDNPPTAKPSATTDALAEQSFSTHLPRKTNIRFTIEDVDSVGSNTVMASDFVVYKGATGMTTDDRFEVADLGGWTLRLKANKELDYEEEISGDNDPSIILRVAINDGTHTPIPSDPITITVQNRNDQGTVAITRDTATKTLTATLTDDDGILTPADDSRAINPRYEWFDVATGERVGTDSNTLTYTDDNAHYRVRVEYNDVWNGANLVNRAETSTAPISLSPNFAQLLEHLTVLVVPVTARLSSDNSVIPTNELTLAFVLPDGTTATTYKGVTLANGRVMPASADRLNYEALTPDERANGIDFIVRATHDGTSVDVAFNVRVSNLPEVVSFGDEYTDYLKTINFLDGRTIATTETIHTATATADSNGAISYALTGTDAGLFNIDATSGAVTFKAETTVDSNTKDIYEFEVIATETGTSNTERQSVTIDVSSIRFTSADTVDRTAANVNHNIDLGHTDHFVKNIETERSNSAGVSLDITGGADMDLFTIDGLIAQGGTSRLALTLQHPDFVKKSRYEVEITATNIVTMEPVVQMFTLTVAGYPESPPVIKLPAGTAADYTTPINIDDEDIDIITFTIEDPDKNYVAGDISVVDSSGTADARFRVTWDESTQTGTLQAAGTGVTYADLSVPSGGKATDPRWTSTFIRVTDTPEGSIASGDDVRIVLRVAERSVDITSPSTGHDIRNADLSGSGSITAATIFADVTGGGASAMLDWAITGGEDAALFTIADRAGHSTFVKLNRDHADFVRKAEYKLKLTATNDVTMDTDDLDLTITVTGFVESAPAITPDRQEEAHAPYDPDADPLAGIVPIPDTDPHA